MINMIVAGPSLIHYSLSPQAPSILLWIFGGTLMSVFFSFSAAFAGRILDAYYLPSRKGMKTTADKIRHLFTARSRCDSCRRSISPLYLVPIFGYLFARGKCPYCQTPIARELFWGELLAFLYGAACFDIHRSVLYLAACAFYLVPAYLIAKVDTRWYLIPTEATFALLLIAAAELFLTGLPRETVLLSLAVASIWFLLFFFIHYLAPHKLGQGDVYLIFALCLGAPFPLSILLPSVAGVSGIFATLLHYYAKRKSGGIGKDTSVRSVKVAFGLYLCAGFFILRLFPAGIL